MTADFNPDIIPIKDFDASKQIKLFHALKQNRFSGQLSFQNSPNIKWTLFLYLGRIIYATGGFHPVRRWRRNLVTYLPQIAKELQQELKAINLENESQIWLTWDYHLLHLWIEQQKINLEQVTTNIRGLTREILFEITQANQVSFALTPQKKQSFQPLAMIDSQQQITYTQQLWHKWQNLGFQAILPDLAPTIVDAQKLQANTSEKTYQILTRLLDGKHTIRDLAVQKQTDSLTFLRSIISYLQLETIDLLEVPDIACPIAIGDTNSDIIKNTVNVQKRLIACVALSPIMCQVMAKVAHVAGYDFIEENNSLEAMPLLLNCKPDIIFIDIELPEVSGYELCTQLRQLNYFSKTPIILLGRNISLIERMKSKMSGASELLQQSIDVKSILDLVQKYAQLKENN